jgi:hypothetical protein
MAAISERPHPGDLLTLAFETINARGAEYDVAGDLEQNFREIAAIASVVTGKALTSRDIAMVMHCVKLIRSKSAPDKLDNYVDSMSYVAFAACFSGILATAVRPATPQEAFKPAKAAE